MRKNVLLRCSLLLCCASFQLTASSSSLQETQNFETYGELQEQKKKRITGSVLDEFGTPVAGANIVEKGTTNGIITDLDGKFSLEVEEDAVLQISYIGYANQEIPVADKTIFNISMSEDTQLLEEVIVVGYGVQKKANLTGSVANVNSELLEDRPITSASSALQGLLPGVTVYQNEGQPGNDGGTIRVRGVGTFNNSSPMILVDGVEADMNYFNSIDGNDIESISVLKDAASAAIYGSKAANGVLLVTTKRGSVGKGKVSYSGYFGWQDPTRLPDLVSSADYAELYNEALHNDGKDPIYTAEQIQKFRDGSDPYNYPNTDWLGLFYTGSGLIHNHSANISGGTELIRYIASVGYQGQDGIIKNVGKEQYNFRLNIDANPMEKLELKTNVAYTNSAIEEPTNPYVGGLEQIFRQVKRISPMIPYKSESGEYGTIGDGNPIAWIDMNALTTKKRHNMFLTGTLKYHLTEELALSAVGSYKFYFEDNNEFRKDIQYNSGKYHGPSKMYQRMNLENTAYGDILLEYNKNFGDHNIKALAGFHSELYQRKYTYGYRQDFPNTEVGDLNAGSTSGQVAESFSRELAMMSWLARVNYDYKDKYLFEANIRYDGTSRFAEGNRWGAFPSLSAGWRLSEEAFFEELRSVLNNVKLRASWGMLGNQSVLDSDENEWFYPTVSLISLGQNYPFGGSIQSGGAVVNAVNPDLKWETTTSWGVGLDLNLFNKVSMTLDFYDKETSDILMPVATPDTYALSDYIDNIGSMRNRGVEFDIQYNERLDKIKLTLGGNISYNQNEILELGGVDEIIDGNRIKRVGETINSYYGYNTAGLYQSQADIDSWAVYEITGVAVQPGDVKYVDQNGDNIVDPKDRVVLGSEDPLISYGFNIGSEYKGFDLVLFFQGVAKAYRYMHSEVTGEINGDDTHPSTFWLDRWTPENTNTDVPRLSVGSSGPSLPRRISDYWYQNASYLRLKSVQLGYNFKPSLLSKIGVSQMRLYYSGQNLLTFTGFLKGYDPEVSSGRAAHYPQVMINTFGINLTF